MASVIIPNMDFAFATLANSPGTTGTSFIVASSVASRFVDPAATNSQTGTTYGSYYCFVRPNSSDPSTPDNTEKVLVTAKGAVVAGQVTFTGTRIQGGSTAVNASVGYQFFYGPITSDGGVEIRNTLSVGMAGTIDPTTVTFGVAATRATSHVMADFGLTVTGTNTPDSGATRAIVAQTDASGNGSIRASEHHAIRYTAAALGATWGQEIGVHSAKAGSIVNNVGIYMASSEAGWLAAGTGVRADTAILITGELGFTDAIRYYDTNGTTVLFKIAQTGVVTASAATNSNSSFLSLATGSGSAFVQLTSAGAENDLHTDSAGDFFISSAGVAAGVVKMVHTGAIANSLVLGAAGAVRMAGFGAGTATFDASGNISSVSDERKKDILGGFARGLAAVRALEPIIYHWRHDSGLDPAGLNVGFSAQQVQGVIPEAIGTDPQGYHTFSDRAVIAALVNAVKEIDAFLVMP